MATIPTGRFVWFEYISTDIQKAQGFFGELFNWGTSSVPMPEGAYDMIALGDGDKATIGGYRTTPKGAPAHAHWLSNLQVASAADTLAKVTANGGTIAMQPFKMGEVGQMAVARDPGGAPFALWQPAQPMGDGNYKNRVGSWCWNELYTENTDRAVKFYAAVAGFEHKSMDMGPMGTYHLLASDGHERAGIMKSPMPGIPEQWMPYVHVANADATVAKAKKLGADIKSGPFDVPNVGRLAIFADTQGAAIGILQPETK